MTKPVLHPASHCPLFVLSRGDGRSAVAAAAYAARTGMADERTGRRWSYRHRTGLISEGLIGWNGTAEALWNAAEASERRGNARVARELRPALPAELPLAEQDRLVRGMALWLRDTYGVAVHYCVHAPAFHDRADERRLWRGVRAPGGLAELHDALFDPAMTNRNFHSHILFATREVDRETGAFGAKTRARDDRKTGPEELLRIRAEWQRRTNQALARNGSDARIDLRSYEQMAADGDAPEGLEAQPHLGPRTTAKARAAAGDGTLRIPMAAIARDEARARNEALHASWLTLRALAREKARLEDEGAAEAARREAERRAAADRERQRIAAACTVDERAAAIEAATSIDAPRMAVPTAPAAARPPRPDAPRAASGAASSVAGAADAGRGETSAAPAAASRPARASGAPSAAAARPAPASAVAAAPPASPAARVAPDPAVTHAIPVRPRHALSAWEAAIADAQLWDAQRAGDRLAPDGVTPAVEAHAGQPHRESADAFDVEIDPETYVDPAPQTPPGERIRVRERGPRQRVRTRGD